MKPSLKPGLILIAVFIAITIDAAGNASTCNPGAALSKAKWASLGKIDRAILVEPFVNQSKEGGEAWLGEGLAEMLGDYLQAGGKIGAIKGITRGFPPSTPPEMTIKGSYQLTPNYLNVFVNAYKNSTEPVCQASFSISPPTSGLIFTEMAKAATDIANCAGLKTDKKEINKIARETSSYLAYKAYINALEAIWKFEENYIDVANIWIEEARKHDIYFQKPYVAQEDMYAYLALAAKAEGKPYMHYLEKVGDIENDRLRFLPRPGAVGTGRPKPVRINLNPKVTNRYLKSNTHYLAGMTALNANDLKKAAKEFHEAFNLVSEDSVAGRALANVYSKLNEQKKLEEIQKKIAMFGMCQ